MQASVDALCPSLRLSVKAAPTDGLSIEFDLSCFAALRTRSREAMVEAREESVSYPPNVLRLLYLSISALSFAVYTEARCSREKESEKDPAAVLCLRPIGHRASRHAWNHQVIICKNITATKSVCTNTPMSTCSLLLAIPMNLLDRPFVYPLGACAVARSRARICTDGPCRLATDDVAASYHRTCCCPSHSTY